MTDAVKPSQVAMLLCNMLVVLIATLQTAQVRDYETNI
jgi:hypothetical protein